MSTLLLGFGRKHSSLLRNSRSGELLRLNRTQASHIILTLARRTANTYIVPLICGLLIIPFSLARVVCASHSPCPWTPSLGGLLIPNHFDVSGGRHRIWMVLEVGFRSGVQVQDRERASKEERETHFGSLASNLSAGDLSETFLVLMGFFLIHER